MQEPLLTPECPKGSSQEMAFKGSNDTTEHISSEEVILVVRKVFLEVDLLSLSFGCLEYTGDDL